MRLRLNSLKTRTAVAIASVIVAILVANAVYLILTKRAELRKQTEDQALKFALLTRDRIGSGYETYDTQGFKFRELMREMLGLNPDVDRIQIIDVDLALDANKLAAGRYADLLKLLLDTGRYKHFAVRESPESSLILDQERGGMPKP
jgi:hypothetical protein